MKIIMTKRIMVVTKSTIVIIITANKSEVVTTPMLNPTNLQGIEIEFGPYVIDLPCKLYLCFNSTFATNPFD